MTAISESPARGRRREDRGQGTERLRHLFAPGPIGMASLVTVLTLAVAVAILRFATTSPLWLDEALSVNIARVEWHDLPDALRQDGAPPLYYALLHVWTGLFGTSDLAVRALSGAMVLATFPLAWFNGRRAGGRITAWAAVTLLAFTPFVTRYASEARMYALMALLVFGGALAYRRALEHPGPVRLGVLAAIIAALAYTHYWAFFLIGVTAGLTVALALRGPHRGAARRMLGAYAIGAIAFVPWTSTFWFQLGHTGTPWAQGRFLGHVFGVTFLDLAGGETQEGWLGWFVIVTLLLLGTFGSALDERRVELDLRTQPGARWEMLVATATLAIGGLVTWAADSAFQSRYAATVVPLFLVVAARGIGTLDDARIRTAVVVSIAVLGFGAAVRNATEDRTQAGLVAQAIDRAEPGSLVVYCPDQLGPSVDREISAEVEQLTFPRLESPERVDWVDYEERLSDVDVDEVAATLRERAAANDLYVVLGTTYRTHRGTCEELVSAIAGDDRVVVPIVGEDRDLVEPASLVRITTP